VRLSHRMARFLCKYRGRSFAESIEQTVDTFHRRLNNVDFNMVRNGELRVLKILSKSNPKCIFDVGANKGEWCQMASQLFPSCTIHAFEIVPSTYMELIKNIKDLSNVIPNNFGLSSEEGVVSVSLGRDDKMATGCKIESMQFYDEYYTGEIECKTRRASDYLKERAIESIDFLKVDVEGMDLKVIEGFGAQIKNVKVVQFEYGIFNIASHDLLSDFCGLFKNSGFVVGKIFPNSVNFFDYQFDMENFHGANYLAVRNNEKELIRSLSRFGA
jgi:FkbM family methyltransferase